MKKIAKLGAVLGLVALGGCVAPYDSYDTSYGGYGAGPYDNGPSRYDTYYGPDYYADRPYYGGGGYRAYNPGRQDGGNYRRDGQRDGQRDYQRQGGQNRDGQRGDGQRDGQRGDGQARQQQQQQQRPQAQAQPQQWQPQPGVSARTQIFGGGGAAAPAPAPSSGWNGFQGRNPNDPNNTD